MKPQGVEISKDVLNDARNGDGRAIDEVNRLLRLEKLPLVFTDGGPGGQENMFDILKPGRVVMLDSLPVKSHTVVEFIPTKKKAKPKSASVDAIVAAVIKSFHKDTRQWLLIEELRMGSGYGTGSERTIDLWALNTYPSKKHTSVSYEIKRSRSDFLVDVKVGFRKHRAALAYSDEFFYVAPEGIIKEEDLPPWAGLIEIKDGKARKVHHPIASDRLRPSWSLICSLLRRKDRILK